MLDVYLYGELIGQIIQEPAGLQFAYNDVALAQPDRYRISVQLPVRQKPFSHSGTSAFFDNLLPEGDTRELLAKAQQFDVSDVHALLGAIGGECAGAVSLWPTGIMPPDTPEYLPCSAADLEMLFEHTSQGTRAFAEAHLQGRQSLSGAQNKLVLLREGTSYLLPRAGAPTNVILKRARRRYPALVQNELAALGLMQAAGVPVAEATVPLGFSRLFESRRYDRVTINDTLARVHQEDLCQATGKLARQKYQQTGGPAIADVTQVLIRYSADPLSDVEQFARWTIANLCIGNNDAHAKNLSIVYHPHGIRLAPAYDVVCTMVYPSIDQKLAMSFGGAYTFESVTSQHLRKTARAFQMTARRLAEIIDDVLVRLVGSVDTVCETVHSAYGGEKVLRSIADIVWQRTTVMRERLSR